MLALAYRDGGSPGEVSDPLSGRAKSVAAAKRAIEIDLDNIDARLAMVLLPPSYGNWAAIEAGCRRLLQRHPDHVTTRYELGMLMGEVGRWDEAIAQLQEVNRRDPFRPTAHYRLIHALWSVGRIDEAENAIDAAMERWPRHGAIWESKFRLLAFSGRPEAAIAFVNDASGRPPGYLTKTDLAYHLVVARSLSRGARADFDAAAARMFERIVQEPSSPACIPEFAALGRLDDAFALAEGYFFGRGKLSRVAVPQDDRVTAFLFYPSTAAMRRDPRFTALTRKIGLERYWRITKTSPDYRGRATIT